MPIYEYKCKNCDKIHELLMKMSDPHPDVCEDCNEGPMVKLISRSAFVLKGKGWYETDFKDKPKKKSGKTDSDTDKTDSDKTNTEKTGSDKTDSSPKEKKVETKKTETNSATKSPKKNS